MCDMRRLKDIYLAQLGLEMKPLLHLARLKRLTATLAVADQAVLQDSLSDWFEMSFYGLGFSRDKNIDSLPHSA